jgi:4-hydroxy-tetrahydrodipicolinate reductase
MGSAIARLVLEKPGLKLAGAWARRAERAGLDLGRAVGLERNLGLCISANLEQVIHTTRPTIAIQTTCSRLVEAESEISVVVRQGVHVISIAEEMAYPAHASPRIAQALHELAVGHGVSILGTGINPGFVLDLLIIALSGVCARIESITASRINDLSPYGPTVLRSQGVGLTVQQFEMGLREGSVVGHVGFQESIHMIARALGWQIERITEHREPIIARVERQTPFVTVSPGQAAGCLHRAIAYQQGKAVLMLNHPQQVHPQVEGVATGDTIEIHGVPDIRLVGSPEIPGGIGTVALAVNMIPRVLNAQPGLHTMADLPVPAAILGDARAGIHHPFQEKPRG